MVKWLNVGMFILFISWNIFQIGYEQLGPAEALEPNKLKQFSEDQMRDARAMLSITKECYNTLGIESLNTIQPVQILKSTTFNGWSAWGVLGRERAMQSHVATQNRGLRRCSWHLDNCAWETAGVHLESSLLLRESLSMTKGSTRHSWKGLRLLGSTIVVLDLGESEVVTIFYSLNSLTHQAHINLSKGLLVFNPSYLPKSQ
ncbi:hypothetical protein KSP40_PGU017167 [Platanthera guangdongensis]|uniref:Uncharacterized protein n=1 Tax=Platanthera guangdongensis TaxID=2320717 RepID=A0ABR2MS00_9ASPA